MDMIEDVDAPRSEAFEPIADTALFSFPDFDQDQIAAFAEQFRTASPFPHLVLDHFVRLPPRRVLDAFPSGDWPHWHTFTDAYQHQKRACGDIDRMPPLFQSMVFKLSGPRFLDFLQKVTGLKGLMPDPYLSGGGLHCSGPGGILAPHADFHAYGRLNLFRRINVLIYFNPGWQEEFGGCLELYRQGATAPEQSVVPVFGRMVMFLTDDKSVHGFSKPIQGPDRWRNSLALYYYTSEDTKEFAGDGVTYWKQHGTLRGAQLARLLAYKVLLHGSWRLAALAHRLNPNFRSGARAVSAKG